METTDEFDIGDYYKDLHINQNLLLLFINRFLIQIGVGLIAVFTAVFFYQKFNDSFTAVAVIFAISYGAYALFLPIAAMLLSSLGIKRMMIISLIFLPLSILSLAFWDFNPTISLMVYIVLLVLHKLLYWTPYHIEFANFTNKRDRGKQVSFLLNFSSIIRAITPLLGGLLIVFYGFSFLFAISSVFFLLAMIPLFYVKDLNEKFSFGFFETFKELLSKKNKSLFIANFSDGVQAAVQIVIWPIFIFILFNGEYMSVGFITSLTVGVLIILRFIIGTMEDKFDRKKMLKFGAILSTTGWLLKIFVDTAFQVLVIDTYHKLGRAFNRMTFDVTTYDQMVDSGHYIDEFTVLKEISSNAGRTFMFIFSIYLVAQFGLYITFLVAGLSTLFMTLLNRKVSL